MANKKLSGYGFKSMKKKIAGMAIVSLLGITALASCAEEAHDDMQVEEVADETDEVVEETTPEVEEVVEETAEEEEVSDAELEETTPSAENTEETVEDTTEEEKTTDEVVDDTTTEENATDEVEETVEETVPDTEDEVESEIEETVDADDVVESVEETVEEQPAEEEIEEISYDHEVEMKGNARAPYFVIDGSINAFCVEPDAVHPSNGTGYNTVSGSYNFDTIFVNASEMVDVDDEVLNRSIQFAIWAQINGNSYESAALAFIGTADVYNALLADVDLDNYIVSYVVYKTEMTDSMGNAFQTLISASVEKKAEPAPEPTPEPEPTPSPEPTPEPAPEPTPSPEPTPAPQPEKPSKPEKVIEKEKETIIEKTVEKEKETVIKETVQVQSGDKVLSDITVPYGDKVLSDITVPQTGDNTNIMFYAVLAFISSFSMIVIGRKNFM